MRDNKLHTPIGVRDILPKECSVKIDIMKKIKEVFDRFGYMTVESPMFEFQEIFGETNDKQMFRFFDRDGSTLALRSDMTPPIARIASTAYGNVEYPLRFSYYGNAFRYNENYRGRLREFPQAGVELIGVDSSDADAEMIALAVKGLMATGLKEFKINIGEVKFFKGILEESGLCEEDCKELQNMIGKRDYVGMEYLIKNRNIKEEIKNIFFELPKLVGGAEVLDYAYSLTNNECARKGIKKLQDLYEVLKCYSIDEYVLFDLGMVNKLDYYTGIIFRGYTYGFCFSVVDGGRYDNLLGNFGKKRPAVGFSIRISEVMTALSSQKIADEKVPNGTLVAYTKKGKQTALRVANIYRESGMLVENSLIGDDVDENMKYAKSKNMTHILYFIDSVNLKVISIADEMGGYTAEVTIDELIMPSKEGEK